MKNLLDIGCGPGGIINIGYYNRLKKEYTISGIDFLPKHISQIKKRYPKGKFQVALAEKLPFKANTFDYILARHVLEHVKDFEKAIAEIRRVTKPGAMVQLAVPQIGLEHLIAKINPSYTHASHHERIVSKNMLLAAFRKNGFKIISVKNQKWPLFLVVILFSILSRLTNAVAMQEQSGVYTFNKKNYLHSKSMYPAFILLFEFIMVLNGLGFLLNKYIPFEVEAYAQKVK